MNTEEIKKAIEVAGVEHAADKDDLYEVIESETEWLIIDYIVAHKIPTLGFELHSYLSYDNYDEEAGPDPDDLNDQTKENFHDLSLKIDADKNYRSQLDPELLSILKTFYTAFGWADQLSWINEDAKP